MRHKSASAVLLGCAVLLCSCEERHAAPSAVERAASRPAPDVATTPSAPSPKAPAQVEPLPQALSVSELPDEESPAPSASTPGSKPTSKLIIDDSLSIGPAGQMTATDNGVVLINRSGELLFSKRAPKSASAPGDSAGFSHVIGGQDDFFAVARGPLWLRSKAYWIGDGKLLRRGLGTSAPLETLAVDARNGTRVGGADLPNAPPLAVYISNPVGDEAPRAKLWVEGAPPITLSPEGAGASSVAAAAAGGDLFVVSIDARSAMTPMHGRRVHFESGKPLLDPDVVLWVGSTSQTLSEVFAVATPFGVRAFLPIERDISHFGLAMLDLGTTPHMDPKAIWRGYPNGIDVAPVAAAAFCKSAFVTYVRPETATPDADQVLEIAEIGEHGLGPAERVAKARGFSNVSLAAATNSAVLAYVADFRTFATSLRCSHQ